MIQGRPSPLGSYTHPLPSPPLLRGSGDITPEKFSNLEMLTSEFQRILDTNINTVRGPIFQEEFF
jgi:hypothetical protein